MKRLLIDGSALSSHMKGVGRYTFHAIAQLDKKLDQGWVLQVLLFDWKLPALPFSGRVQFIKVPPCSDVYKGLVILPLLCRKYQADLLFTPMEALVFFTGIPRIVVCHDINELIWHSQGENAFSRRGLINHVQQWLLVRGLRKCIRVICNSEYVRNEVVARYHIDPLRTHIGYCGVDQIFRRNPGFVPAAELVVAGQQLRPGYLLAFATGDVRENPELLPEIFALVRREISPLHLVIGGIRPGSDIVIALARQFASLGLQEHLDYSFVPFLGESAIGDLAALYRNAALYLELSSHEGFGMQLAEAMASGIHCVSGRGGALPEVGGIYTTYFDDRSVATIASAVVEKLRNSHDDCALQAQMAFAKRYSWEDTGSKISGIVTAYGEGRM